MRLAALAVAALALAKADDDEEEAVAPWIARGGYVLLIVGVLASFWGLAVVVEDFFVPALNIMCERNGITEDVAGATLLAAGCNAPELISSVIDCFLQHSTDGTGTVVGSTPFNLMCICGGAAIAVKGNLKLDPWLMVREVGALFIALVLFVIVMQDSMVQASDARNSGAILPQFCRNSGGATRADGDPTPHARSGGRRSIS